MNVSRLLSPLSTRAPTGPAPQVEPKASVTRETDPAESLQAANASVDIYHGPDDSTSDSLLALSGVTAYSKLQNTGAIIEKYDRAVELLTNGLAKASSGLQGAYHAAVSTFSAELRQKDWGFSVSDGNLVFIEGSDKLSAQDRTDLQEAFGDSGVEVAASQVATAVVSSINLRRESGAESGNLGWGRFEVDEHNFKGVVDLRAYVASVLPGGKYNTNSMNPTDYSALHTTLAPIAMLDLIGAHAKALPSK